MAATDLVSPRMMAPAPQGATDPGQMPATMEDEGQPVKGKNGETLSPQVLRIPAIQGLFAGAPTAVSLPLKGFDNKPEAALLKKDKEGLEAAGMGFYRSLSGQFGVIFNQLHIHAADIQAADKAGKLLAIAPPFDAVNHQIGKAGPMNPVLHRQAVPGGLAQPVSTATPPQLGAAAARSPEAVPAPNSPPVRPAPASVGRKLAKARVNNLQPGAPTSGGSPGAGRLINEIMKPVV